MRAGTWSGTPTITLRYRLAAVPERDRALPADLRCEGHRYRLTRRDRGMRLRVAVTARNRDGSSVQVSRPTLGVR